MSAVTPGLVCGHHHLYSALARGMPAPPTQPTTFLEILEQVWWRLDVALDPETIRWSAMLGAVEALQCGTTAIVDHHESPSYIEGSLSIIAEACAEVGVRTNLCYGVTDRHGPHGAARGLAENERFLRAGGRGMVGVHAAFTCSDDTLHAAAALAADLGVGVHIHVAEGRDDIAAGVRLEPLARDDWWLVHCVFLDRTLPGTIAHNPRSNMNNSVGYAQPATRANRIVLDDRIMTSGAVAVMCSDDVPIRPVVSQGCRPIGSPFTVTGAERNLVYELAGQPAMARLRVSKPWSVRMTSLPRPSTGS